MVVDVDMDSAEQVIEAFAEWFEGAGFQPRERYPAEESLKADLLRQAHLWVSQNFRGWRAERPSRRPPPGPFGYAYESDIELVHTSGMCIPVEVKLMKAGWEPNQAIGQAIMYSRTQEIPRAIAAVLDARNNPPDYGELERSLRKDLWQKLGVRLCVRRVEP